MSTSPEYSRPSIEPVDDNTISFIQLDDVTREKKGEEECRTPTGEEYRLVSVPDTCPPAPRKKFVHASCKKRLMEVDILSVKFEEVEEWFRSKDPEAKVSSLPLDSKELQGQIPAGTTAVVHEVVIPLGFGPDLDETR